MRILLKIPLLLSLFFVSVMVAYYSIFPTYVLQISIDPHSSQDIQLRRDKVVVINSGKEPLFFDIAGEVFRPTLLEVSLSMRDPKHPEFKKQGDFKVSRGSFLGTVQLGSAETPIISDQDYPYIIESGDDKSRLSEGSIQVQVKAVISGTSQWWMRIIAGIGLLASVLQIISFIRSEWKRNRNPTLLGEPVALDGLNSTAEKITHEA
jgi:hypothetical protein